MSDYPQCENCQFFTNRHDDNRQCQKYDFVMPEIDWQMVCKDWRNGNKRLRLNLTEQMLYYYSYGSGQIRKSPIAPFRQLQNLIVSVTLRRDEEFGWVIYPRQRLHHFPQVGASFSLFIGEQSYRFCSVYEARNVATAMTTMGDNVWEMNYHEQYIYMLYHEDDPNLLYYWANQLLDFDAYMRDCFVPSLFAFVEIIQYGHSYALHPDLLAYEAYRR